MPQALADVAERTVATYLQPLPGLMAASNTTDMVAPRRRSRPRSPQCLLRSAP